MTDGHAVIVLAAGGSRRLGRLKQSLTIAGRTLLARTVDLAIATAPTRIVVVLGADEESLAPTLDEIAATSLTRLHNPDWQEGIASSLRLAASELADWSGRTLVLGCDQPRLQVDHLRALLDAANENPLRDMASRYNDAVGIPALVRASTLAQASALSGDRGLRALWRDAPADVIAVDAPELVFDIDTPDDLVHAIASGWIDQEQ